MFRRTKKPEAKQPANPSAVLAPGTPAPDFDLPRIAGERQSLSEYRGNPVILVFYPADWSSVCGDQLSLYNEVQPLFSEYGAQPIAIVPAMPCSLYSSMVRF